MTSRPWIRLAPSLCLALALGACTLGADGGGEDGADGDDSPPAEEASRAPFFLPTAEPTNTSAPRVEVDGEGRIHAVYPAFAGGGAFYAVCDADCTGPDAVEVVELPTEGTVANAMLALDDDGRPRVLLSTFSAVVYATCDDDCGSAAGWRQSVILEHGSDREVTGEALALDPQGRPRFVMHTYVAYLGIGQKTPETLLVSCDGGCLDPGSWAQQKISDQIWQSSALRYDAEGRAHLATVAHVIGDDASTELVGAYLRCDGDCAAEDAWKGVGLETAYRNDMEAVSISPAISLALTGDAAPRIAMLGQDEALTRRLVYFACDEACEDGASWAGIVLSEGSDLGAGLDLALDADDRPRVGYTFAYNIGLGHCEAADCTDADWQLAKVELGQELEPDDIFLEWNCTVAAWFLHSPSVAIGPSGRPRVGYQARDISGGFEEPNPEKPDCRAGTDMTWSRLALLGDLP